MKRKYDLIFGLGRACGCSQTLRRAGLQHLSFPGDWTAPLSPSQDHDLRRRVDTLCDNMVDFFRPEDFRLRNDRSVAGKAVYENTRTHYLFNHDFPFGGDFASDLPKVAEKYRRRRDRLFELIGRSHRVLVVNMDIPGDPHVNTPDDCRYARRRLGERFPSARFDCLLVSHDPARPFEQRTFEVVEDGLFLLSFDFLDRKRTDLPNQPDLALTSAALAEHFAVRDYRTQAERAAYRRKNELAKFERAGVSSRREYLAFKWRKSVLGRLLPMLAGLRRKKFTHIVPLGINCEAAFWFNHVWGFVDSSLFAWALTHNLDFLTKTLSRFDDILSGTATFDERSFMWKCDRTGVYFHGRFKRLPQSPLPDAAALEADLADLRGRISHLKEKFRRYLADADNTLFVYRIGDKDTLSGLAGERLDALEAALSQLGARNWKLLVVCEKANRARVPGGPNRLIRTVSRFNSTACVTDEHKGDEAGWRAIYSEFAPARILPKAHKFKFE